MASRRLVYNYLITSLGVVLLMALIFALRMRGKVDMKFLKVPAGDYIGEIKLNHINYPILLVVHADNTTRSGKALVSHIKHELKTNFEESSFNVEYNGIKYFLIGGQTPYKDGVLTGAVVSEGGKRSGKWVMFNTSGKANLRAYNEFQGIDTGAKQLMLLGREYINVSNQLNNLSTKDHFARYGSEGARLLNVKDNRSPDNAQGMAAVSRGEKEFLEIEGELSKLRRMIRESYEKIKEEASLTQRGELVRLGRYINMLHNEILDKVGKAQSEEQLIRSLKEQIAYGRQLLNKLKGNG